MYIQYVLTARVTAPCTCGVFSNLIHLFPPQGQNKAYPS